MGGTFGCIGTPLTPMPAQNFIQKLQSIYSLKNELHFFAAPTIKDSSELKSSDWLQLSIYIKELSSKYQHFIIIHGTDTLSYAAAFLHHIFADTLSIIFTGSQYPLLTVDGSECLEDSDASANFKFAYEQSLINKKGVYLAFNAELHTANTTYKRHTEDFYAFLSFPKTVTPNQAIANNLNLNQQLLKQADDLYIVNYYLYPSHTQHHVKALLSLKDSQPNILILQGFGSGNLPYDKNLEQCLEQFINQGCWVIISSQVLSGSLSQKYATGSWLNNINLVFDPHHSQADLYARAVLLYLQYGQQPNWQQYWV